MIGLVLGPALAGCVAWYFGDEGAPAMVAMGAVTVWMAVWWVSEAVPLPATALLPLVLFPALSIMPAGRAALAYGDDLLFLFLGGLLLALGVEESGLHRRVALAIVAAFGDHPRRIVLGFMLATAVLSMWMSNSATTMLLLPIGTSILARADDPATDVGRLGRFGTALMLGIAYAASIGGFATLVGTPTNVAFKRIYLAEFVGAPDISFGGWMLMALPLSLAMLLVAWAWLVFVIFPVGSGSFLGGSEVINEQRRQLGPMKTAEKRMAVIFAITAVLWVFREPLPGWGWAPPLSLARWSDGLVVQVSDATVAMMMALVCFVVPKRGLRGPPMLNWHATRRLPWGVLLLFGGGLALASGMSETGLGEVLGEWFGSRLDGQSVAITASVVTLGMTFATELLANMSCVAITMPVLADVAVQVGCDPRLLMIPATLAANCAFMLPVGTPPNAIVYASGRVPARDMLRAGLALNLMGVLLTVVFVLLWGIPTLGIKLKGLPEWAAP